MQAGTRLTMVALMLGALGDSTAVSAEDALTLADVRCVVVGMPVDLPMATNGQWLSARWDQERAGGERGIRTLEGLLTLTPLAGLNRRCAIVSQCGLSCRNHLIIRKIWLSV